MATRLFLCNLKVYNGIANDIAQARNDFAANKQHNNHWTCGNVTSIERGDVAYFMRTGDNKRGIFASGRILRQPAFKTAMYCWDAVVDFNNTLLISDLLQLPQFDGANFYVRGSGYRLDDKYTDALDTVWQQHVDKFGVRGKCHC